MVFDDGCTDVRVEQMILSPLGREESEYRRYIKLNIQKLPVVTHCDSLHFDPKAHIEKNFYEVLSFLICFYFINFWNLKSPIVLIIMAGLLRVQLLKSGK